MLFRPENVYKGQVLWMWVQLVFGKTKNKIKSKQNNKQKIS